MKRILISLMVLCFAMFVATAAGADEITVDDGLYSSLQAALDNALYDTVIAEGTFDIDTQTLTITRPVKLTTNTGAAINGEGSLVIDVDLSSSGLVEIDGNNKLLSITTTATEDASCIWIDHEEPFADLTIAGCVITGPGAASEGIANRVIGYNDPLVQQIGDVLITGNEISGFSQAVHLSGWGSLLISNNEISASYWTLHLGVNFGETEISDNTVYAGWFSGIGPGCADGVQVLRNEVHATGYTYYPIGAGFGATNCVIEDNVIDGNGYFAIGLLYDYHGKLNENNTIKNNDSSEFTGTGHVYLDPNSWNNSITNNAFGGGYSVIRCRGDNNLIQGNTIGAAGWTGMWIQSGGNRIVNNTFMGNYPGFTDETPDGPGYLVLTGNNNLEVACKSGEEPYAFDLCDQILDLGTGNKIPGYEKCEYSQAVIDAVNAKIAEQE